MHLVRSFLEKKYVNELVSIILFGSMIDLGKNRENSSDVDLLVILKDSCSKTTFNQIKQNLSAVEASFFSHFRQEEISIFKGLQFATGMFLNIFVCRYSDFRERRFRVFSVNRIMGKIAPQNSVWWSIQKQHQIIWGEDVFRHWETFPLMT
ncbi:MAG: nucleotidyltransferase domain-containing protein, partial [Candidatus Hodarchaeota archaeon]